MRPVSTDQTEPVLVGTVRPRTAVFSQIVTFIAIAAPPLGALSAMGLLWGVAFHPVDLVLLLVMYVLCGLGITVGFHRLFTHKSFATGRAMTALLAILGSMTLQGPVTQWVTDHRKHHRLSDRPGDPHSPHLHGEGLFATIRGLWHAHVGWLLSTKGMERGETYGKDLYDDPLIRWIDRLYFVWVALSLAIPFAVGALVGGGWGRGVEAMVWGGVLRIFLFQHATWAVNSICHSFGRRPFSTTDESRNNWMLAPFTFGEAWHNNHHAFPTSARHGLAPRQFDISWLTIRGLERMGLVWNVRLPSEQAQRARAAA